MKRIFSIVFFMVAVLCSSHAQHLEFMGIPIDGSIEAFDAKLKAKGFVKSKRYGNLDSHTSRYYDAKFIGKDAFLTVESWPKRDLVFMISVSQYFKTADEVNAKLEYYENKYKDQIVDKEIRGTDYIRYELKLGYITIKYTKVDFKKYKYGLTIIFTDKKNFNALDKEDI